MATIVNARDVLLQAASPRFLGVQVGSNIQVPIVNIPGLSTALDGTREVTLTGTSQVYQIPKTGSISPASITVSAVLRNLTGTPTLTLTDGTMSVTPALTGGVFTFTPAQMTSDTITLHLSLTVGPDTFTDDWTVVKVREGADALTGFLTNESCTVAADKLGNVTSYTGVNGNFKVFQGATDVTTACTFAVIADPYGLTDSLTASGAGAGTYSVSGGFPVGVDQVTLTYRATFGSTTIDKVFSISKSKAGSNGTGAFTLVGSSGLTIDGSTITKTGGTSGWNEQAYSVESYVGGAYISFRSGNTGASLMGALTPNPTVDASYGNLKYAWYAEAGGTNCYPWGPAGALSGSAGAWSASTVFSIVYDGTTVKWFKDGVLSHSVAGGANEQLFFDSSFAELAGTMNSLAFGPVGAKGANGTSGARGSQTFYVAISGTSYSDAVATSTASVGGGPIYGDVVTQYDNASNFALSKFWDGTSSWVTINAVVDGNLLVQGTVGAQKLIVNNGSGNNLWWDANYQQPDQWTPTGNGWGQPPIPTTTTAGKSSQYIMWSGSNTGSHARFKNRVPVTVGKQYRMSVWVRGEGSPNGTVYFRLDGDNVPVSAYNQIVTGAAEGSSPGSGTWVQYTAVWTATYPYVGAMLILNYTGTTGYMIAQDIRIEELMDSALIVTGGITADRIDSRGLSIKDGAGNIILAAGSALDWSNLTAQPSGIYNNNIYLSGGAINGIGTGNGTAVANSNIVISSGAISGIGSGDGTAVANSNISVSSGTISGIGTGNGSTVDNGYIGINGSGQFYGGGAGTGTTVSNNQISVSLASNAYTINGIGSAGTINIGGLGYTGDLNATVGAPSGTYVAGDLSQSVVRPSNPITTGNVGTYIASAAIGSAYIGVLTAANLTVTALSNTVNGGASSGGRVEITTNRVDVYDASNVRRVRLGEL